MEQKKDEPKNRLRNSTVRFSMGSLFRVIQSQDDQKGDLLAASNLQS